MSLDVYVGPSNPEPGQVMGCYWGLTNGWTQGYNFKIRFYLDGKLIKEEYVGYLAPGQGKEGSFRFTAPTTPGKHTLEARSYLYINNQWMEESRASATFTVKGTMPIEEALMQELKRWYKKNVDVPVSESYDWSFDVTGMVRKVHPNIEKAYLYGWYKILNYTYAGKGRPQDRTPQEIVSGWEEGWELALLNISTSLYNVDPDKVGWYWVKVPCRLCIEAAPPRAEIVRDLSQYPDGLGGLIYNGKALPTGTVQVHRGERVEYLATAVNRGGPGTIWIRVLVNGTEVDRAKGESSATVHGYITVNQDMTIKFEAGHGDTKDDEWGC